MSGNVIGKAVIEIGADASGFVGSLDGLGRSGGKAGAATGEEIAEQIVQAMNRTMMRPVEQIGRDLGKRMSAGAVPGAENAGEEAAKGFSNPISKAAAKAAEGVKRGMGRLTAPVTQAATRAGDAFRNQFPKIVVRGADAAANAVKTGFVKGVSAAGRAASATFRGTFELAKWAGSQAAKATAAVSRGLAKVGKVASNAGRAAGRLLGGALKTTAIGAAAAVGVAAGAALNKGFSRLTNIDTATKKLEGLGYTGKTLTKIMDSALASVKGTAFGLDEAATVASNLTAAGVSAGGMEKVLKNVANVAAVAGTSMAEMSDVFTDAAASGKITGDTLARLEMRGVAAAQIMAKDMGISVEEFRKKVSAGEITFDKFNETIGGGLGKAAKIMGTSFKGMAANIGAAAGRLGAVALGPVFEGAKKVMPSVIGLIDKMTEAIKPFVEVITPKVNKFFKGLKGLIDGAEFGNLGKNVKSVEGLFNKIQERAQEFALNLITDLPQILADLVPKIANMIGSRVSFLIQAFQALVQTLVAAIPTLLPQIIQGAIQLFTGIVTALVGMVGPLLTGIVQVIGALAQAMVSNLPLILASALGLFRGIVMGLMQVVPILLQTLVSLIGPIAKAVLTMLPMLLNTAVQLFLSLVRAVLDILPDLIKTIAALLPEIIGAVIKMIPTLLNGAIELFTALIEAIPIILPILIDAVVGLIPVIISNLIGLLPVLLDAAVRLFTALIDAIPVIVPMLVEAVPQIITALVTALVDAAPQLLQAGKDLIQGLINGIGQMGGAVKEAIGNIASSAIDTVKGWFGIASPSKVFREIGVNVVLGYVRGVKATAPKAAQSTAELMGTIDDAISQATDKIAKRMKGATEAQIKAAQAGVEAAGAALKQSVNQQGKELDRLWKEYDKITAKVQKQTAKLKDLKAAYKDLKSSVADSVKGELDLSQGFEENPFTGEKTITFAGVAGVVSSMVTKAKKFRDKMKALVQAGYPKSMVQMIAGYGMDTGIQVAEALLSGSAEEQAALKADYSTFNKVAGQTGKILADQMYAAGIAAQEGIVKGLTADQTKAKKAAQKLAKSIVAEVKKELGIKSPSRVFAEIGVNTSKGFIQGVQSLSSAVSGAMSGLASGNVNTLSKPSAAGVVKAPTSAPRGGDSYHIEVTVPVKDLAELRELDEFMNMLRVRARMSVGSTAGGEV